MHAARHPELSKEQKQEIKEAFGLFDTDKDGTVDYHELNVTMRVLGFDLKKVKVLKTLCDHDKTGHTATGSSSMMRKGYWHTKVWTRSTAHFSSCKMIDEFDLDQDYLVCTTMSILYMLFSFVARTCRFTCFAEVIPPTARRTHSALRWLY